MFSFFKSPAFVIASFVFFVAGSFIFGYRTSNKKHEQKELEYITKIMDLEREISKKSIEIITKHTETIREIEGKTKEIIKNVPVYITKEDNNKCIIPASFISLHNDAANSYFNRTAANTDEAIKKNEDAQK